MNYKYTLSLLTIACSLIMTYTYSMNQPPRLRVVDNLLTFAGRNDISSFKKTISQCSKEELRSIINTKLQEYWDGTILHCLCTHEKGEEYINYIASYLSEKEKLSWAMQIDNTQGTPLHRLVLSFKSTSVKKRNAKAIINLCPIEQKMLYLSIQNRHGYSALFISANNSELMTELINLCPQEVRYTLVLINPVILHRTVFLKCEDGLKALLSTSSTPIEIYKLITIQDPKGDDTPLHAAALTGNSIEIIKQLVSACPQENLEEFLNMQNKNEETPLHLAAANGHQEITQYLLEFA